jgi:RNA polymerase sigma-70 factor (ECF subfamily)
MKGVPTNQQLLAVEALHAKYAAEVYRFALRLSGDRDEAEDLAAEAFAQAVCRPNAFRGESSPKTWLCGIVLNRFRMLRRRDRTQRAALLTAQTTAETISEDGIDLANAIAKLPEHLREAFFLVKGEGFTHAEAAEAMRVPVGTVYSRVHSAVRRVREELTPKGSPARVSSEVSYDREL